ncbi:MAG: tyramine oxidase subunit B [Leucobacter sp.]
MIDFIYLDEPDMIAAGVTDMARCVDSMEDALVLMRQGDYVMAGENHNSHGAMLTFPAEPKFAGMPKDGPDRRIMAMPAYLGGRFGTSGVKWYGSNAENRKKGLPRSILMFALSDADTGAPLAIMSANLLSAYRTGAVPGVGVKHLARKDAEVAAVIGPGVIAKTTVEATLTQRPSVHTVKVKGRSASGVQSFADFIAEKYPAVSVVAVDTVEEALDGADIVISTATTGSGGLESYAYFPTEALKPGALVVVPAPARFDDELILSDRSRLIVDSSGLYEAWREEYGPGAYDLLGIPGIYFLDLVEQGKIPTSRVEEISDIATGERPGRQNDEEIIIYSVGGMPVEDVAWATDVYHRAVEQGVGQKLNLWDSPTLA